jgi:hypothetical protein
MAVAVETREAPGQRNLYVLVRPEVVEEYEGIIGVLSEFQSFSGDLYIIVVSD